MSALDDFYSSLIFHLLDSGVENDESIDGYSEEELKAVEIQLGMNFPEAYRLFEGKFGKKANFYDSSEYQLAYLSDALEVMQGMVTENSIDPHGLFPFSQWQGYSVFCFKRAGDNPEVVLFVAGDRGMERYSYTSFTNWLLEQISIHLKYQQAKEGSNYQVQQLEGFITSSRTFTSY